MNGVANQTPQFAIVVATRDRGAKIQALIESVIAGSVDDFEMVIVDQSSNDLTLDSVRPFLDDVRISYVRPKWAGASRARNLGIALTTAPLIAITDDDCTVPVDWLKGFGQLFEMDPNVGVIFCTVEAVAVDIPGHTPAIIYSGEKTVHDVNDAWKVAWSGEGLALGAGMGIRRSMLADVDGFDELLGPGSTFGACEDNDLSWRGLIKGWATMYSGSVVVLHNGFRNTDETRQLAGRNIYALGGTSAKYLRAGKWGVLWLISAWWVRTCLINPASELMNRRLPRGFRQPIHFVRGLMDGMRMPIDQAEVLYTNNTSRSVVQYELSDLELRGQRIARLGANSSSEPSI